MVSGANAGVDIFSAPAFCIVLLMLLTLKGKYVIDKVLNFAYNMGAGRNTLHTRVSELAFKRHVMSSLTGAHFKSA